MGDAALRLGRAMGYQSAGTVEFLVDDESGEFCFLEVNTRLQVEHPVTEAVTGVDLVREQLRVAAGERLDLAQSDVTITGHAIEARLYAEDAAAGFLPATGTLAAFRPPAEPAVRWDSGVEAGSVVGVDFDPMLAKVIAHGPTRTEAAGRLARALERLHVGGVTTNRDFLAAALRHEEFLAGDTTTDFIERLGDALVDPGRGTQGDADQVDDDTDVSVGAAIAAAMWLQGANRAEAAVLATVPSGWRNARLPRERVTVIADGDRTRRRLSAPDGTAPSTWPSTEAPTASSGSTTGRPAPSTSRSTAGAAPWRSPGPVITSTCSPPGARPPSSWCPASSCPARTGRPAG